MKIIVASKNPNKIQAVEEMFQEQFPSIEIIAVEAKDSPEQPKGFDEILKGAKGRASETFSDCNLSVGLESGVIILEDDTMIDLCVCSLYDGKNHFLGSSGGFVVPKNIAKYVKEGKNLSEATKLAGTTDHEYVGHAQGLIGILSKGKMDRKGYTKQAIEMALIHFNSQEMHQ